MPRSLNSRAATAGRERIEKYLRCILHRRSAKAAQKCDQANFARANPEWAAAARRGTRIASATDCARAALRARDRSAALLTVAAAVIERYRAEKERRGLLDYDDLIDKTLALLRDKHRRPPGCSTSSISASTTCWSTRRRTPARSNGRSRDARRRIHCRAARAASERTLFAVGDEKQSIFSFQGAAPRNSPRCATTFAQLYEAGELPFAIEKLRLFVPLRRRCARRGRRGIQAARRHSRA